MKRLQWFFLLACVVCIAIIAWNGRWEGYLTRGHQNWIVDLDRAPLWAPPPMPPYARFLKEFKESEDFPDEDAPGLAIRRVLRLDWMAIDVLLYLWGVTVAVGWLYLAVRKEQRNLVLHLGLSAGIGLTAGVVACVGLWLLFGGWGPPFPEFFGGLGLAGGIVVGLASFRADRVEQVAAADRPRE